MTTGFKTMSDSSGAQVKPALRHGHIATPASRAYFAWQEGRLNAGQLNQREAGKFFPALDRGLFDIVAPTDSTNALPPPDGKIASANQGDGLFLDEPGTHWKKHTVASSEVMKFTWTYTAAHTTRRYNYFITREDWNPNLPLSRAQFESEPFFKVEFTEQPFWSHGSVLRPTGPTTHDVPLPQRNGYHVLLAVWEVADTGNAFYQVIDLDFAGSVTPDNNDPVVPAGLRASATTTNSITMAWNASVTAGVTYRLYRNGNPVFTGSQLSFTDNGLQEDTAYSYSVSAVNAAGQESARSQIVSARTSAVILPGTPPTAPVQLHSMSVTTNSVALMWGSSTGSVSSYIIYRDGNEVARVPASQLSYTDAGLQEATTYRYFVAAENAAGQLSVPSNVLSITTAASNDSGDDADSDYPQWVLGGSYQVGQIVRNLGRNWVALVTHISYSPDWAPGLEDSLWREVI
ncbi:lytic polysaccharide monooxygenase [Pantoea sp. MBD-2R]|uniref:lytic polysaccharide monooxygenase n=1 Tax=Pantoea sp. MBD-2R TaxID=3141540 RepID=UPI00318393ED